MGRHAQHKTNTVGQSNPAPTSPSARTRRRGLVYLAVCVVLLGVAALTFARYFEESPVPPAPPGELGAIPAAMTAPVESRAPVAADPQASTAPASPSASTTTRPPSPPPPPFSLPPSPPVSMRASDVGISSSLLQVGLNEDRTIEVPSSYDEAAWYHLGPTPGALGPAVIIGHVDSFKGPGVFFNLGDMRPGQVIDVTRADQSVARFRVDAIKSYAKDLFPTEAVYGPVNYAGLRLVTCGGAFDEKTNNYESNVVVFASLIQPRR